MLPSRESGGLLHALQVVAPKVEWCFSMGHVIPFGATRPRSPWWPVSDFPCVYRGSRQVTVMGWN